MFQHSADSALRVESVILDCLTDALIDSGLMSFFFAPLLLITVVDSILAGVFFEPFKIC
jgi:hypothetical protein